MSLFEFTENDLHEYTQFVNGRPEANAYHNLAWVNAVKRAYNFPPKLFGLKKANKIVAVLPCVLIKNLKNKKVLCSLPYCDLGGVLAESPAIRDELMQEVVSLCVHQNWHFEYRDTAEQIVEPHTLSDGKKVRMLFELLSTPNEQLASFKPKLRSQIKKAIKNGITARVINKPSKHEIDDFYRVFTQNMRDLGSPVHARAWFESIFSAFNDNAFLVLTDYDGKCVGGGIVLHTQAKAVIPWASTLREYNKLAPNMLLYWEVLSEVIKRNINEFDFGRSSFNEGTYRFKKQWGAQPQELQWQSLKNQHLLPEQASESSSLRQVIEKAWQKLPVGVSAVIGPKIRKHISL